MISALIFDCDGTLVDSEDIGIAAMHAHALPYGLTLTLDDVATDFRGKSMARNVAELARHSARPFPDDFTATAREAMAHRFRRELKPMPGALEFIARLELPFCVATNGPRDKTELTLGLTGLLPYFEGRIYCAYEVGHFKPEPQLFLQAAAGLGVAPEHCAVVEDSVPGIQAGLAAGMQVFSLCHPETIPPALAGRITQISGVSDLKDFLG
ncbi:HAD family hydrolase [Rhodoferax koreense]|uniref:HAD family hydrolase n=1 Tax=Rhodoferax koreensis TaxID=1842727 RepID=UPI0009FA1939|nr:HAD-IA family hydrolase [Rhodoferax koreense]